MEPTLQTLVRMPLLASMLFANTLYTTASVFTRSVCLWTYMYGSDETLCNIIGMLPTLVIYGIVGPLHAMLFAKKLYTTDYVYTGTLCLWDAW